MNRFRVTYDIVTPESAEVGDYEESGFVISGGWKVQAVIGAPTEGVAMDLRQALELASPDCDSGTWFSESDGRTNYKTGAQETRSIHPPAGITPSSYRRLARLMGVE